jgi:cytochrome c oxidase assembly protein subunit 15
MADRWTEPWSPPRWLRYWAGGTLALLFALLTLGAFVTSFQVGMADPIWPTRPWHLLTIDWNEPKAGYLVEHTHRLIGFVVGGMVSILAIGLWLAERKPVLRWIGLIGLIALLGAFGQLHGTLIQQQTAWRKAQEAITSPDQVVALPQPNWFIAAGPTVVTLAVLALIVLVALRFGSVGRGLRALGVLLLVGVMAQGLVGGLRVYLDALLGTHLAATHGVFSQVVLAIAVCVFVGLRRPQEIPADDRMAHESAARRAAMILVLFVFGQVIAGAILRHTQSPMGPRLHLLLAFAIVGGTLIVGRFLADAPRNVRRLYHGLLVLIVIQLALGIESWLIKYANGFSTASFRRITELDALMRTAHAVVGYALFAVTVALALALRTVSRVAGGRESRNHMTVERLEAVA